MSEKISQALRLRIASGHLTGGASILAKDVGEEFGVSLKVAQEAVAQLASEGLLVSGVRGGMRVRLVTVGEVDGLYQARLMLEKAAVERLFDQHLVTDDLVVELQRLAETGAYVDGHMSVEDMMLALTYDRQFHRLIVARGGVGPMLEWHEDTLNVAQTILLAGARRPSPASAVRTTNEHAMIVAGFAAGSRSMAIEALVAHLESSRENAKSVALWLEGEAGA